MYIAARHHPYAGKFDNWQFVSFTKITRSAFDAKESVSAVFTRAALDELVGAYAACRKLNLLSKWAK